MGTSLGTPPVALPGPQIPIQRPTWTQLSVRCIRPASAWGLEDNDSRGAGGPKEAAKNLQSKEDA